MFIRLSMDIVSVGVVPSLRFQVLTATTSDLRQNPVYFWQQICGKYASFIMGNFLYNLNQEHYYYYYYYYCYYYFRISHSSSLAGKCSRILGCSNQQD